MLKGKSLQPRLQYQARISFKTDGEIKRISDKQKLREYTTIKLALQQMLKGFMTDYFGGSKVTADGDCSHEMKRCLLVGRKAVTDLKSVLKSRDITLLTKGPSSQSYGFSSSHVWMRVGP